LAKKRYINMYIQYAK